MKIAGLRLRRFTLESGLRTVDCMIAGLIGLEIGDKKALWLTVLLQGQFYVVRSLEFCCMQKSIVSKVAWKDRKKILVVFLISSRPRTASRLIPLNGSVLNASHYYTNLACSGGGKS